MVLVSDYGYGAVSDELIDRLRLLRGRRACPLLVDAKNLSRFHNIGATILTPNHFEAWMLVEPRLADEPGLSISDLGELERLGQRVLSLIDAGHVAITLGADGVFLASREGETLHIPAYPVAHANDVGAGDSFAAAMALALGAGSSVAEAGRIAIEAASIAVTKHRTAIVHHQELLQRISLIDQADSSDASTAVAGTWPPESLSRLLERLDIEREQGRSIVFTNGVFDILHAGHVQFLRRAKALGDVLVVGVNSDQSAKRLKGKGRPINSERDRMALVAALEPVDHVVLFEEETPIKLIRALRPHLHVKGGDYADERLPEAEVVQEVGGRIVILPLAGSMSTSKMIDRIVALAEAEKMGAER
jgi:D-beta-D-heptose 7-phosphate kinase/D-beta-D-heptose 1-phosphate adenosyltransferase